MSKEEQPLFIQERLQALHQIDNKLVSILSHSSSALTNLIQLKKSSSDKSKQDEFKSEFRTDIENFYQDLQFSSVNLKKEIQILDSRIGETDSKDITILPISINKKATFSGEEKLKSELDTLQKLLGKEPEESS
ncbi:hypothetical protein WICMUC_003782 [Wickerhamomyces mucosus]|uniref:Mediator of RNA polymerase II transcription subunit 11 n=1 Tax=Wickerhamomyces mucosus TaxID=1378264 RepID=A0A9P8PJP8_9ASCO|nr:hypothetical protein WICMUC_003782 [Wickerhamomyces mucosus]